MVDGHTSLIFLFGDPVSHSLSPFMHNHAIEKLDENACYLPLRVPRNKVETAVKFLRMPNVLGANVTIPHKEAVIPFIDELSNESKIIGAVNTIQNRNGILYGTTTDPEGILQSINKEGFDAHKKNILILGSGGSARTVAFAFAMKAKPKSIYMAARSPDKLIPVVKELKEKLELSVNTVDILGKDMKNIISKTDILINCTSAGMIPNEDSIPIKPEYINKNLFVYDLVYNPINTQLLNAAKKAGAKAVSGLGMLINQGRLSLEIWLSRKIPAEYFPEDLLIKNISKKDI